MRISDRSVSKVNPKLVVIGPQGLRDAFLTMADRDTACVCSAEPCARLALMEMVNAFSSSLAVLYDGNTVWSRERLVRDVSRIVKRGDMSLMTDYLYKFVSLSCGSIAHYDKAGWIAWYPTVNLFRRFFLRNEFGRCVLDHIPRWHTDALAIAGEIMTVLGEDDDKEARA